jgi:predicted RNA binding protein YcfA (HicA-like mRNA interferase family)
MSRLPSLRPREVVRALERAGFAVIRVRGSHYQLLKAATGQRVTVPYHNRDLSRGTLNAILHQAGLAADEFLRLI